MATHTFDALGEEDNKVTSRRKQVCMHGASLTTDREHLR